MFIIKPHIFNKFPEIVCAFSTKIGLNRKSPYYFNLSLAVGDDENLVRENRETFFRAIGLSSDRIAFQAQIHSDIVKVVDSPGQSGESDGLITTKTNLGLAISAADCVSIYIYDFRQRIISAVHSGWRGTQLKILEKTIKKLFEDFNSKPENLFVYLGPSISQKNYEVGKEVAELFDQKYLKIINNKFYLDVASANYDMLIENGILKSHIQKSGLCTFEFKELLHSYRRAGLKSGRSLGVIAIK